MKKFALILLASLFALPMLAQNTAGLYGHGQDSIDCTRYLSFYREYMKQNNMEEALPAWKKAISVCPPNCSQNMLIDGMKLLRFEISKTKVAARRAELVDSLILMGELRAENFPKYAVTANNNKAIDMINYKWAGNDNKKLYDALKSVIAVNGPATTPMAFAKFMEAAVALYKDDVLSPEVIMDDYSTLSEQLDKAIATANEKTQGQYAGAKQDVDNLFANSGVASCENLVALFTPRYEADPENKDNLQVIVTLLGRSDCVDTDLYLNAVQSLNKLDPSANTSFFLYRLLAAKSQDNEAAQALEQAIQMAIEEGDNEKAGDYSMQLGTFYYKILGRNGEAISAAKKSIELSDSNAGKAYLLIGTIWGSLKCGGNEIERRAPYWVATDYMNKAKAADPSLTEDANRLSAQYRNYFPQQADAFMYDVVDGQSYTVACGGLRETTTVRTLK